MDRGYGSHSLSTDGTKDEVKRLEGLQPQVGLRRFPWLLSSVIQDIEERNISGAAADDDDDVGDDVDDDEDDVDDDDADDNWHRGLW